MVAERVPAVEKSSPDFEFRAKAAELKGDGGRETDRTRGIDRVHVTSGLGRGPGGGFSGHRKLSRPRPTTTQAGAHPDLTIGFSLDQGSGEAAENVTIAGTTGLALLPLRRPTCASSDFAQAECSSQTQVGVVTIHAAHESDPEFLLGTAALYARAPAAGQFAELGFWIPTLDLPVTVPVGIRSAGDHGLRISLEGLPQSAPLQEAGLTLWGVPAATAHDGERLPKGTTGCPGEASAGCGLGPVVSPLAPNDRWSRTPPIASVGSSTA